MISLKNFLASLCFVSITYVNLPSAAQADMLEPEDASYLLSGLILVDNLSSFEAFFGSDDSSLSVTDVNLNDTGWSYQVTGEWLGLPLSLEYEGDATNFSSSSEISWTTQGSYGSLDWLGSGSADFTAHSFDSFSYDYSNNLSVGESTALTSLSTNNSLENSIINLVEFDGTTERDNITFDLTRLDYNPMNSETRYYLPSLQQN